MRGWPKLGQRWGSQSWRLRARINIALQASSSSMKSGDCPSPTTYWWCLNVLVRRRNASTRCLSAGPMQAQGHCTSNLILFRNPPASLSLPREGRWHYSKVCCRHCYKTLPYLTINTTSSKKLTPQADKESGQYRSGHDWYSKLIKLEHEHRLLKFWTESCALHYRDLLASKKQ